MAVPELGPSLPLRPTDEPGIILHSTNPRVVEIKARDRHQPWDGKKESPQRILRLFSKGTGTSKAMPQSIPRSGHRRPSTGKYSLTHGTEMMEMYAKGWHQDVVDATSKIQGAGVPARQVIDAPKTRQYYFFQKPMSKTYKGRGEKQTLGKKFSLTHAGCTKRDLRSRSDSMLIEEATDGPTRNSYPYFWSKRQDHTMRGKSAHQLGHGQMHECLSHRDPLGKSKPQSSSAVSDKSMKQTEKKEAPRRWKQKFGEVEDFAFRPPTRGFGLEEPGDCTNYGGRARPKSETTTIASRSTIAIDTARRRSGSEGRLAIGDSGRLRENTRATSKAQLQRPATAPPARSHPRPQRQPSFSTSHSAYNGGHVEFKGSQRQSSTFAGIPSGFTGSRSQAASGAPRASRTQSTSRRHAN